VILHISSDAGVLLFAVDENGNDVWDEPVHLEPPINNEDGDNSFFSSPTLCAYDSSIICTWGFAYQDEQENWVRNAYSQRVSAGGQILWDDCDKVHIFSDRYKNFSATISSGNGMIIAAPGHNSVALQLVNANGNLGEVLTEIKDDNPRSEIIPEFAPQLYPNPANSSTTISFIRPSDKARRVTLFNLHGGQVYQALVPAGVISHPLDISAYPSGSYFLQMECGAVEASQRLNVVK